MDANLQSLPSLLLETYNYEKNREYDSVATRRVIRKGDPPIRSFFARLFYKLFNQISQSDMVDGSRSYRLMSKKFMNVIIEMFEGKLIL